MDPTLVNLNAESGQFLSENSEIPLDIIFKFTSDGGDAGSVAAHKIILAMVSQIFRNMFFVHNTVDKSAKVVFIEDSNKPTFQIMIDAVYNVKPMKESLQGKSVDEMFAVLYLVTKYKISSLELAVKECLSSFPITEVNALDVADDVMEYLATFEEAAQSLLLSCAKLLKSNDSFVRVVAENGGHAQKATVLKLAVLIMELSPVQCSNCKRAPTDCLNGTKVTQDNVEIGIKVVRNPDIPHYRRDDSWGTGVITRKDERVEIFNHGIAWFVRWENNQETGDWPIFKGSYFLFKCQ